MKLLMTMPGVDVAVASALVAALGDVSRFRDGDRAASYLGIVPSTRQSSEHCYHGPITKHGNSHARWLMIQAAQHVARHPGPLGVFFRRLASRKNRNVAVVATARKLVVIAWRMLTNNEPYRYAVPRLTEGNLSRLRVAAGVRRKRGSLKGRPRSTAYGTGQRTRAIPSLEQVCQSEGLPPVRALSAGETRMLQQRDLTGFVESIHTPRREPRSLGGKSPQPRLAAGTLSRQRRNSHADP